uniref:AlNc14C188G8379 protein n=1 Tax=Albugo laibachii Nc14 TaxID=890382 RepID=F0WFL7_9STRA|nr:AlNc14C84G5401 [Albugo laibachii Nc14]CCA23288.1 AlNc14C188G8379 [Albugo laibachii Nc14]|eukprot:CCA23288.1 AlNc14C188G8379 [Albugo laibachii Nc14]
MPSLSQTLVIVYCIALYANVASCAAEPNGSLRNLRLSIKSPENSLEFRTPRKLIQTDLFLGISALQQMVRRIQYTFQNFVGTYHQAKSQAVQNAQMKQQQQQQDEAVSAQEDALG